MEIKLFLLSICILILLLYLFNGGKKKKKIENFNIFNDIENPGNWIGDNMLGFWKGAQGPLTFTRNYIYNTVPNYTWVTRYYDKKNDWIRANKGLPPLLPAPASKAKMTFNINTDTKNKEISVKPVGYLQSLTSLIN
jgi:hypothetical protein